MLVRKKTGRIEVDPGKPINIKQKQVFEDTAAIQITCGTYHIALNHRAHLQRGETLLVTGAGDWCFR